MAHHPGPWGLAFIQSFAVDKRLTVDDLRYERVDVIVVACAATLHAQEVEIGDARDAARAHLELDERRPGSREGPKSST